MKKNCHKCLKEFDEITWTANYMLCPICFRDGLQFFDKIMETLELDRETRIHVFNNDNIFEGKIQDTIRNLQEMIEEIIEEIREEK